ncbi:Fur-regulated basic protein FbpA [Priestia koreensis]|uniref:Fur-regulated basic protein FbpA n=1 Tax=Priestia koreensis TaxID=284581 RepID=A0A0M0L516_9BACI|nr:Fur-regulated basic protein FbpA [Priestia koreensis]KOO46170.1 hypothetical protein AMD01_09900 [Priestia koreensis]MCM3004215.1 Fur-regulated basic protein FbpA [Priestia koreensis]UNL83431.1 Fur-regulated basic protein FbpA [Priestia koreensis]
MGKIFQEAVEMSRKCLIQKLLFLGVYRPDDPLIYSQTLSDLERDYKIALEKKGSTNQPIL